MGFLSSGAAQAEANDAAKRAKTESAEAKRREQKERLKIESSFVQSVKGRSNPFRFFGGTDKLGGA